MPQPSQLPIVIPPVRGTPEYARFLDRLEAALRKAGVPVASRCAVIEHCLGVVGLQLGLKAPTRCNPRGTNRFGKPKTGE